MFCAVVFTHLSVSKLYVLFLFASHTSRLFMSNPLWVCLFLSVCLSVSPLSFLLGLHPRIFSHPNVLPMLGACQSPPAPHPIIITHWMPYGSLYNVLHEGTSEYLCSGHKVRTCHHLLVVCRDLWFIALTHLSLCCYHFKYSSNYLWTCFVMKPVMICHLSCCQTLSWTRRRRWSLPWTLLVEWPSYTHWNRWSLATISTARVSW